MMSKLSEYKIGDIVEVIIPVNKTMITMKYTTDHCFQVGDQYCRGEIIGIYGNKEILILWDEKYPKELSFTLNRGLIKEFKADEKHIGKLVLTLRTRYCKKICKLCRRN